MAGSRAGPPNRGHAKVTKMRATGLVVVSIVALVAGACQSTQEVRAADEARCRSYGFRRSTDAFAKCLLDIDLDRSASRRSNLNYPIGWYGGRFGRYW